MKGPYDKDDAAEDTDTSISDVSEAWHQARDDSGRDDSDYSVYSDLEEKTQLYETAKENMGELSYIMDASPDDDK